jgi:YgiT-type zinc finger domain-containing protein
MTAEHQYRNFFAVPVFLEVRAMECMYCRGTLQRGYVPSTLERNGYHLSWDAVPAWVCTQCGEPLFESRAEDLMQEALRALDQQTAALTASGGSDAGGEPAR